MKKRAEIEYIIAVAIFGTIGVFLKEIIYPSEIVVMYRGILGALFVLCYSHFKGNRMDFTAIKKNLIWVVGSGMVLGINWIFLFAAYDTTTVAIGSLCNYMAPIILIILAPILYKEKFTLAKLGCVIAAFVGIVFVSGVLNSSSGDFNILGMLYGFASAFFFVLLVVLNRKLDGVSVYDRTIMQLAISAITVFPYALIKNWHTDFTFDLKSAGFIVILGVVHTGLAYIFYLGGMKNISVFSVAVLGYIEPAVCVLCSAFILNEHIDIFGWIGAVLIIGAAVMNEIIAAYGVPKIKKQKQ